jgi:hypothetical protein
MPSDVQLTMAPEALRPLIAEVVAQALARLEADRQQLSTERLAYSEAEAAALLGLAAHQLRDERLRGRILASVGPGRRILYTRDSLLTYLASRPWSANGAN